MRSRGSLARASRRAVMVTVLALLAAGVTAVGALAAAEDSPAPPVPAQVLTWFEERAPELVPGSAGAVLELSADQLEEVSVGEPVTVTTWAPGVLEGTSLRPALVTREHWVAALTLEYQPEDGAGEETPPGPEVADTDGSRVAVGVVHAGLDDDGDVTIDQVTAETGLAQALHDRGDEFVLVLDEEVGGWFGYADGTVHPLTDSAQDVLAGSVSLEIYQPFLVERHSGQDPTGAPSPGSGDTDEPAVPAPVWAAALLVALLVLTGAVVWLRRPEDDRPSRP